MNITRWNPKPNNRLWVGLDWMKESQSSVVGHKTSAEGVTLSGDVSAEAEVDTGDLVGHWWMILHTHTQGRDNEVGMEGGQPTINGLKGWHPS